MSEPQEKDFLVYKGNKIPRAIRLVWTIFFAFAAVYLAAYAWGDLMSWLTKK